MGRKRSRTRKCFFLFVACVMFAALPGCTALKQMEKRREAREDLGAAQERLLKRDYSGALKQSQRALSLCGQEPPADEALFITGLVHAHLGHVKKDHKRSMDVFRRVMSEFPQSHFAGWSAIWIEILQESERSKEEIEEFNRVLRESRQENQKLTREIEELNRTIRSSKQIDLEIDAKKKALSK